MYDSVLPFGHHPWYFYIASKETATTRRDSTAYSGLLRYHIHKGVTPSMDERKQKEEFEKIINSLTADSLERLLAVAQRLKEERGHQGQESQTDC